MKKIASISVVAAAMVATATLSPVASSVQPQSSHESMTVLARDSYGNATAGMVTIDLNESTIRPLATKNVGGGTWSYGTTWHSDGSKTCYSNYIHGTTAHTATAILGSQTKKAAAGPGAWAKASVTGGLFARKCHAYWSTQ